MKEGWEYKTLGECCEILNGYPFKSSLYSNSGIRVIRITNVQKGYVIDSNPKYYPESKITEISNFILKNEDILISLTGNVGRVAILQKEFLPAALNQRVACLRIKDKIVNKKFLFFYLNNDLFEKLCIKNSTGAAQLNMSTVWLKKQIIPIPSYDEQRRIVSYLDSSFKLIDEIKDKALKSLTEAKALFQSALAEAMEPKEGWEEKTLGEVSENTKNINWKNESSAYKYIDLSSVDRDKSIILNTVIVNKTNAPSRAKQLVNNNDIIFATTRPLLRRVTLIEKEYDKSICSTGFCVIRPNNNIIVPKYVFYVFKDEPFYQYIEPLQNGASYPAVTDKAVKSYTFSFPKNVEVQKRIVSRLDKLSSKVRAIEEKYQKMVEECDALKQAMLRDVFE